LVTGSLNLVAGESNGRFDASYHCALMEVGMFMIDMLVGSIL